MDANLPTSRCSIAVLLGMLPFLGCAQAPGPGRPSSLLDTPIGEALEPLWKAHGGLEAWNRHGQVRVDIGASRETGAPLMDTQELVLRFSTWPGISEEEGTAEEDYYRQSARFFFQLPFWLARSGWELRQDVYLHGQEKALGFWAIPASFPSPQSGYYLVPDPDTRLLRSVYYQSSHPLHSGELFVAEFRDYHEIDGVVVAMEVVHRPVKAQPPPFMPPRPQPIDPFLADGGAESRSRSGWILRYSRVRFEDDPAAAPPAGEAAAP